VLVETAFISNPQEERMLRDPRHQRRIAEGIHRGLKRAAPRLIARRDDGGQGLQAATPLPAVPAAPAAQAAPLVAGMREHVVKPGETLSAISRLYDIHVDALRFLNELQGNDLTVGMRLRIPARAGDS
jgi:N-acetylmuramoyl-L-alanine amidase